MVGRGGTVDSSQRDYGELGAGEQVEPGSAEVDEGGLAVAWQEFTVRTAKSSMSVSPVTKSQNCRCEHTGASIFGSHQRRDMYAMQQGIFLPLFFVWNVSIHTVETVGPT